MGDAGAAPRAEGGTPPERDVGRIAPAPDHASSPAEFIGVMRALKEWSGLTYRQLQRRAGKTGDTLPHSTIAAVLSRGTLPREELVAAFVRACGQDETAVTIWLAARKRLAAQAALDTPVPGAPAVPEPPAGGSAPDPADLPAPAAVDVPRPVAQHRPTPPAASLPNLPAVESPTPGVPVVEERSAAAPEVTAVDTVRPAAAGGPDRPDAPMAEIGFPAVAGPGPEQPGPVPAQSPVPPERPVTRAEARNSAPVFASGRLASVAARRKKEGWVGMHRHDPATEVPRPAGLRWLVPPIMYRTGWASRVLSGVLVLVMAAVAVAVIARAVRDSHPPEGAVQDQGLSVEESDQPGEAPKQTPTGSPTSPRTQAKPAATGSKATGAPSPTNRPAAAPLAGPYRIHLAHTGLCVGEGPELYTAKPRTVLGQHTCSTAGPPTSLEHVSGNIYRIKLDHPQYGIGCATVDYGAQGDGLLIAGDDCGKDRNDQKFSLEPVKSPVGGTGCARRPGRATASAFTTPVGTTGSNWSRPSATGARSRPSPSNAADPRSDENVSHATARCRRSATPGRPHPVQAICRSCTAAGRR
ncbi:helix-turn-helix domain-containing protein [Micromonospora zhanjiangensis]